MNSIALATNGPKPTGKAETSLAPLRVLATICTGLLLSWQTAVGSPIPAVPRTWDDGEMTHLNLPLADPRSQPKLAPAQYYYRIPVQPIYKSYPVYCPDKEPPGYLENLRRREPEVLWDDKSSRPLLETQADWISAGERVFDAPILVGNGRLLPSGATNLFVREKGWYRRLGVPATRDGVVPFYRYVIREKGKVELGILSCAMCHTRVMPDGSMIKGAQGNFPIDRVLANDLLAAGTLALPALMIERSLYTVPWLNPDPEPEMQDLTLETAAARHRVVPPGVVARHGTGTWSPVQVPDLIGVRNRRYLDRTGLQRHRGPADMMRYAALNQGGDDQTTYAGRLINGKTERDAPETLLARRYSDEQLYALTLYLYSLKPPPNPNLPKTPAQKALVARGRDVFRDNGCAVCHDPKQGYTNNKLIAAPGFDVPKKHPERDHIMSRRVNTDPTLTLKTRRGTGFYKVPSLLGVWYRGPFEHNGSCATLEDWFDPRRLHDDYVPTGWKGPPGTTARAVLGHKFGLDLSRKDLKALLAFLRTL
jgi:hypothetical protein